MNLKINRKTKDFCRLPFFKIFFLKNQKKKPLKFQNILNEKPFVFYLRI